MVEGRKGTKRRKKLHMSVPLHCRCLDQRKDSGALVLCEICDRWFHESCVTVKLPAANVDDGNGEEDESFVCRDCHKGTTDVLVRHDVMKIVREKLEERNKDKQRLVGSGRAREAKSEPERGTKRVRFEIDLLERQKEAQLSKEKCPCKVLKGGSWIKCDLCSQWWHISCDQPFASSVADDTEYSCRNCRAPKNGQDEKLLVAEKAPSHSGGDPSYPKSKKLLNGNGLGLGCS
ncbi:hypothetical protein NDN08_003487 [Rhodosorus marinus]|uniref:PHD-type domain-containing protein n=1 Tax=Rhodosorus marinus TaxID=101924 RepID=A0AAV8UWV5_9RHOD|nr:hypothetical protein NDN08_003487 [Rhodosorus marinus]